MKLRDVLFFVLTIVIIIGIGQENNIQEKRIAQAQAFNIEKDIDEEAEDDPEETKSIKLNLFEELIGSLDEFSSKTTYTRLFDIDGTTLDESLNEGEIIVGIATEIIDRGFISEKDQGNVLIYYIAPAEGGIVQLKGFDGQFFVLDKGAIELNQAIAAMRTLIDAHGATTIQFHEIRTYSLWN